MTLFLQICAALGGFTFVGGIITALAMWRKSKAEATKAGADAASVLTDRALRAATTSIENLEKHAEKLGQQLDRTTDELRALRRHMAVLEALLRDRGVPVPQFDWPPQRNGVS